MNTFSVGAAEARPEDKANRTAARIVLVNERIFPPLIGR